jgi:hypothetical protein
LGSDRLALGAALLLQFLPLFIAGNIFMTIDPPMFFCWGLATYFAAVAIFDQRPWVWALAGIVIGIGFLAKYSTMLWFVGAMGYLLFHSPKRQRGIAIVSLLISSLFALPVILWNHRHSWVSLRHVARQTGASAGAFDVGNIFGFIGGQMLVVGPLAIFMVAALVYVVRNKHDPNRLKLTFLAWIGTPFFVLNLLASLRAKVQANWPAPAYFTLLILAAYFVGVKLQSRQVWNRWRGLLWVTVVFGLVAIPFVHGWPALLPLCERIARTLNPKADEVDPVARLRGWQLVGTHIKGELGHLAPGAFVLCDDYQQTAEMAFYVPGNPKTYCAGSYFGKRLSQYDVWSDRRLDATSPLIGRDAIYLGKGGKLPSEMSAAFAEVEKLPEFPIIFHGVTVRTFKLWRCRGFVGMQRPPGDVEY